MDKTQTPPEPLQAALLPTQEAQIPTDLSPRKRQIDSDSDDDKSRPKRVRLTRKNLATFDKMGKKKTLSDDLDSTKTKTTSTTSSGFAMKAHKNGILEPAYSKPPVNLENIRKQHAKSRATTSPPESVYNDYVDSVEGAGNEATLVVKTSGRLLKEYPKGYSQAFNRAFTNYPKSVGFNNDLSSPQPDFIEGLEMLQFDPFPVDEHVPGAVLYRDDPRSITLPQIAGGWKGPDGSMKEATLQSSYDGAALVHARSQALSYMGKSDPPGHAEVTTFTTDGTTLNQYAHYEESEDGTAKYHQYRIKSINLINSHEDFKDGYKHLRNAQDHAKTQSEELRDQLREYWEQQRSILQPTDEGAPFPLPEPDLELAAANANEEAAPNEDKADYADYEIVEPHCRPTPIADYGVGEQSCQPTASSGRRKSSQSLPSTEPSLSSGGHKRKASSSQSSHGSSGHVRQHRSYWKKDPATGRYYHGHSNGTKSWLDDEDEEDGY